jgi:hypothetical protein
MRLSAGIRNATAATLLALSAAGALATDIASAPVPSDLSDLTVQVARRRLHLPAGHWVLVARTEVDTIGHKRGRSHMTGSGVQAWIAREDGGRLTAVMWLSLPQQDYPGAHHQGDANCPDENGIDREDASDDPKRPDCMRVQGHRDMRQALSSRSPAMLDWMAENRVASEGPMVRFTYRYRGEDAYGGISLFLPTGHFDSEAATTGWVKLLREACRPLFEGRERDANLPPLPAPAPAEAGDAAASGSAGN